MIAQNTPFYLQRSTESVSLMKKVFGKRQVIFRQAEKSEGLYELKSGSIKLQRVLPNGENTILKIVTEGEIFGEYAGQMDTSLKNSCFAVALEENTRIEPINMVGTIGIDQSLRIIQYLAKQAKGANSKYEKLLSSESEARVKFYLKDLALRKGQRFGMETLLKINLTHQEWAMLSDTSRQTVTQTLSTLKKKGIITYSRNRILFRNLETFN